MAVLACVFVVWESDVVDILVVVLVWWVGVHDFVEGVGVGADAYDGEDFAERGEEGLGAQFEGGVEADWFLWVVDVGGDV